MSRDRVQTILGILPARNIMLLYISAISNPNMARYCLCTTVLHITNGVEFISIIFWLNYRAVMCKVYLLNLAIGLHTFWIKGLLA